MILEIVGFLLSSVIAGVYLLLKLTDDIFPLALKRFLTRLVVSNWIKSLPQIIPVYHPLSPKSTEDAGICASDSEWKIEKPRILEHEEDADTMLLYGINDKKDALVIKFSRGSKNRAVADLMLQRNNETFTAHVNGSVNNSYEFSIGNLKLELIEPFRSWRIWYNGPMQQENSKNQDLVHVTLNFLWKPLEDPADFRKNANTYLLSNYFCQNGIFGSQFSKLSDVLPQGYNQFGCLHGIAKVDSKEEELYLYGYRQRYFRNQIHEKCSNSRMEFFGINDVEGDAIRLMNFEGDWVDGITSYASLEKFPTQKIDCRAESFFKNSSFPKLFELKDKKKIHRIEIWPEMNSSIIPNSIDITLLKMDINGKSSHGILIRNIETASFKTINEDAHFNSKMTQDSNLEPNFVTFDSTSCTQVNIVGGKGASLAKLAILNSKINAFRTVSGFCATTQLFKRMIDVEAISEILLKSSENLEEACAKTIELIKSSGAETKIASEVAQFLDLVFSSSRSNMRFAVRSSGVLEDGSDLSCAGQNETFLGVEENQINLKIVDCWASLFTLQSVQYRLNHGQPAVSEMAVVIQEMVNPSAAGVLFTADPRTGNPFEVLITANYGLGESVVSGSSDPDTISVIRPKNTSVDKFSLTIGQKSLGSKKSKVVISSSGKNTEELQVGDADSSKICISDDNVLKLGMIGVHIESALGQQKPVDIEWAISNAGEIYILQCRAMTSLDAWTDFEVNRQFDSGLRTQVEQYTTANTGEVMPKPLYAISAQSLGRVLDFGIQKQQNLSFGTIMSPIVCRMIGFYQNRCFLNTLTTLYTRVESEITPAVAVIDLSLFGRPVIDDATLKIALQRYGPDNALGKLKGLLVSIKVIRNCKPIVDEAERTYGNWSFTDPPGPISPQRLFDQITKDLLSLKDIIVSHCATSQASSTAQIFVFLAVTEGRKAEDWPPSLYEDAGQLLAAYCEVESAEMPSDIASLADKVLKYGNAEEFLNSKSTNEAVSHLTKFRQNSDKSDKNLENSLNEFLAKHGHRSIAELDVGQISWREDPTQFIHLLKSVVRNKHKWSQQNPDKKEATEGPKFVFTTDEDLLNSLKTPLKNGTKKFLKFMLPHYRRTVSGRERTKSICVRVVGQIRQAYHRLAELMVMEQMIPEKGLIRHLAHHEIKLLIKRDPSSASILYRATRRQRLYSSLLELDYPEISRGLPIPIDRSLAVEITDVIKATPVSSGRIKGIAKVCLSVEEASMLLEQGDILITNATDIAWSPFFPMLGGVVTELGGLISHGAVVAREYGLPCLVGAINATKIFKTGDEVILDTATGILSKVKA